MAKHNKTHDPRALLYLLTALFILLPGSYILWMLKKTTHSETTALKNEVRATYQENLISASRELTKYWARLENNTALITTDPMRLLSFTGADSFIIYINNGRMRFP